MHPLEHRLIAGAASRARARACSGARGVFAHAQRATYAQDVPCIGAGGRRHRYAVLDPDARAGLPTVEVLLEGGAPGAGLIDSMDDLVPITWGWEVRSVRPRTSLTAARLGDARLGHCFVAETHGEGGMSEEHGQSSSRPIERPERPLVEEILTAVQRHCDPQAEGWEGTLRQELQTLVFDDFEDGQLLTADHLNRIIAALGQAWTERGSASSVRIDDGDDGVWLSPGAALKDTQIT